MEETVAGGRFDVSVPAQLTPALDGARWVLVPGSKVTSASFGTGEDVAATVQLLRPGG
jgi:hypothetical protein